MLWRKSDEILLVKVVMEERSLFSSLGTCFSNVNAEVLRSYKLTRIDSALKELRFSRTCSCDDFFFPEARMLTNGKQYFIFLSSDHPGMYRDKKNYSLVDNLLGIQEYSDDWEGFLFVRIIRK